MWQERNKKEYDEKEYDKKEYDKKECDKKEYDKKVIRKNMIRRKEGKEEKVFYEVRMAVSRGAEIVTRWVIKIL